MSESSGADGLRRRIPGMTSLEKLRILANNLLDRSEELRAENAAMRPIVEAVARFDETNEGDGAFECHWCAAVYDGVGDAETDHLPDCSVTRARALLAKEE
jgi:hypothetical protein